MFSTVINNGEIAEMLKHETFLCICGIIHSKILAAKGLTKDECIIEDR